MNKGVDSALKKIRALLKIPGDIKKADRISALLPACYQPMHQGIQALQNDVWVLLNIPGGVKEIQFQDRHRLATEQQPFRKFKANAPPHQFAEIGNRFRQIWPFAFKFLQGGAQLPGRAMNNAAQMMYQVIALTDDLLAMQPMRLTLLS